jgi:hypothetical protein
VPATKKENHRAPAVPGEPPLNPPREPLSATAKVRQILVRQSCESSRPAVHMRAGIRRSATAVSAVRKGVVPTADGAIGDGGNLSDDVPQDSGRAGKMI